MLVCHKSCRRRSAQFSATTGFAILLFAELLEECLNRRVHVLAHASLGRESGDRFKNSRDCRKRLAGLALFAPHSKSRLDETEDASRVIGVAA